MKIIRESIRDLSQEFKQFAISRDVHFHKFFKFRRFNYDREGDMEIGPIFTFENFKEIFYDFNNIGGNIKMIDYTPLSKEIDKITHFIDQECSQCMALSLSIIAEKRDLLLRDFRGKYIEFNTETTYQHIPPKNDTSNFLWNGCFIHVEDYEENGLVIAPE